MFVHLHTAVEKRTPDKFAAFPQDHGEKIDEMNAEPKKPKPNQTVMEKDRKH